MNGSQIKAAAIQKAKQVAHSTGGNNNNSTTTTTTNAASNGNANKKRKKELKPIITTEGQQDTESETAQSNSGNTAG